MSKPLDHPTPERAAHAIDAPRTFPLVAFKALGDGDPAGSFEAIVAVYGNIDSYGDRIRLGFFEQTLKPPPEGRGLAPVVWTHAWDVPPIGVSLEMAELDLAGLKAAGAELQVPDYAAAGLEGGLYAKGRFLVATDEDHAVARQVWAGMKALGGDGRPPLREWSFGFKTLKAQWVEEDPDTLPAELQWTGGEIRDLLEGRLYEYGPTLVGANPATETIAAKSAVKSLELRGLITSDEATTMLREMGDTPRPNATEEPGVKNRRDDVAEEVKARIAELAQAAPPTTL